MESIHDVQLSRHFAVDRSNRGIDSALVKTILDYGEYKHDGHRAKIFRLTGKSFQRMKQEGIDRKALQVLRKKQAICLVVSNDECVVTGYYANQRHKRIRN